MPAIFLPDLTLLNACTDGHLDQCNLSYVDLNVMAVHTQNDYILIHLLDFYAPKWQFSKWSRGHLHTVGDSVTCVVWTRRLLGMCSRLCTGWVGIWLPMCI